MTEAGRVIAGTAKGVRLLSPGEGTRPLADRVKQTLFAILEPDLAGSSFLDLFAGSGAGGIEALSRGASAAVFVERDGGASRVLAGNLRRAGFEGPAATIARSDVVGWLVSAAGRRDRFDVALIDPPYAETGLLDRVLALLGAPEAPLTPRARVVAKHFWRDRPPERIGMLAFERDRRFGETALTFYRRMADEEAT